VLTPLVDGGYVNAYSRDITERKKASRKLETLNEKLEVVGGLTRHDVNNKLATVRANVYLAKQGLVGDNQALEHLREIESAVGQAEQIFDFAKFYEMLGVEELDYMRVEVAVEGACKQFSDLRVRVANDCGGVRVLADSLLNCLFYNLIDNSLKYSLKKSVKIRCYYEETGDNLQLVYEDDGVGILEVEKEKIFEQGYGKGSGLGLYLIKKMCEVYGWTIEEAGVQGEGVRFIMTLPKVNVSEGKPSYIFKK
jgi:signal transduction histidine kinase